MLSDKSRPKKVSFKIFPCVAYPDRQSNFFVAVITHLKVSSIWIIFISYPISQGNASKILNQARNEKSP